jgi:predicted MPP superfamily phosphohydrolase
VILSSQEQTPTAWAQTTLRKASVRISLCVLLTLCAGIGLWHFCTVQNNAIEVTTLNLRQNMETAPIRILHLSDLQCKRFGEKQALLLTQIHDLQPDIIVFTGDLVDAFHYDSQSWRELVAGLPAIAPTYFVSGNHEWWRGNFEEVATELSRVGVHVLRNQSVDVGIKQRLITIVGIEDTASVQDSERKFLDVIQKQSEAVATSDYAILLTHRPEYFDAYDQTRFDLVLAGHAHGGQIRLPWIGGLLAPNQGLLPRYTAGLYTGKRTQMVVSRGLGNSVFPLRIFNRPEIVLVII